MAIRTDYRVTDETLDGLSDVFFTSEFDAVQDSVVITLEQDGSEVTLTGQMARNTISVLATLLGDAPK